MIDTGADENYLSKDIASKLNLEVIEMKKPILAECANGNIIKITDKVKLHFKCSAYKCVEYLDNFYILPQREKNSNIRYIFPKPKPGYN